VPKVVIGGSFRETVREASRFFMKTDDVHDALARVTRRLAEEGIDYALIGGMALVAHGFVRFTANVNILITAEGLSAIHEKLLRSTLSRSSKSDPRYREWHDRRVHYRRRVSRR
jgi:hypothetical protein